MIEAEAADPDLVWLVDFCKAQTKSEMANKLVCGGCLEKAKPNCVNGKCSNCGFGRRWSRCLRRSRTPLRYIAAAPHKDDQTLVWERLFRTAPHYKSSAAHSACQRSELAPWSRTRQRCKMRAVHTRGQMWRWGAATGTARQGRRRSARCSCGSRSASAAPTRTVLRCTRRLATKKRAPRRKTRPRSRRRKRGRRALRTDRWDRIRCRRTGL